MNEVRELYEKHPSQGGAIVTAIMDTWKHGLEAGGTIRLLKIRIRELSASDNENLALPEPFRQGIFCGWEYVLVHCPHCDKYKLVSAKTHTRILACEKCQREYSYFLDVDKQILVRFKKMVKVEGVRKRR